MFSVVEGEGRTLWVAPRGTAQTFYKGQLLSYVAASKANTPGTVVPLAVPAGAADLTNYQVIAGIITGFNRRTPATVATVGSLKLENAATVVAQADQLSVEKVNNEGMYPKSDQQLLIQMTEILPHTIVRGPIYNAAYGTAHGVSTLLVADVDGMITPVTAGFVANEWGATAIANAHTLYCRSGANAGIYRVSVNTTATAPAVTTAFPYNAAVGDTFIHAPLKQGHTCVYIGGPGLYIDSSKVPTLAGTTLFSVIVYKLDLSTTGREYAEFRFGGDHFCAFRA